MDVEPARLSVDLIVDPCCGNHLLHITSADTPTRRHDPHLTTFRDNLF
jgi:hypothetical protein